MKCQHLSFSPCHGKCFSSASHTHTPETTKIYAHARNMRFFFYIIQLALKLACVCFVFFSLFSIMRTIYSMLLQLRASTKLKLCPWILLCVCLWLLHVRSKSKNDQKEDEKIATSVDVVLVVVIFFLSSLCSFVVQHHHHHWTNKEKNKQ